MKDKLKKETECRQRKDYTSSSVFFLPFGDDSTGFIYLKVINHECNSPVCLTHLNLRRLDESEASPGFELPLFALRRGGVSWREGALSCVRELIQKYRAESDRKVTSLSNKMRFLVFIVGNVHGRLPVDDGGSDMSWSDVRSALFSHLIPVSTSRPNSYLRLRPLLRLLIEIDLLVL
jgi:hypothetical protein